MAAKVALLLQVALTAVAAVQGYRTGGARGAAVAAGDNLTFGAVSAIGKLLGGPASSGAVTGQARVASARLALSRAAAVRTAGEVSATTVMGRARAVMRASNGIVDAHTRRGARGQVVRVNAYRR